MKAYILGIAGLTLAAISCTEERLNQSSNDWTSPDAVLTVDSETILTYDPLTCSKCSHNQDHTITAPGRSFPPTPVTVLLSIHTVIL